MPLCWYFFAGPLCIPWFFRSIKRFFTVLFPCIWYKKNPGTTTLNQTPPYHLHYRFRHRQIESSHFWAIKTCLGKDLRVKRSKERSSCTSELDWSDPCRITSKCATIAYNHMNRLVLMRFGRIRVFQGSDVSSWISRQWYWCSLIGYNIYSYNFAAVGL